MEQSQSGQGGKDLLAEKAEQKIPLKNHNPNEEHNAKKVALGPNTKR